MAMVCGGLRGRDIEASRNEDFTGLYKKHFEVTSELQPRPNRLRKDVLRVDEILYPDGNAVAGEVEELLVFAMEARRRVREHILRIDDTFKRHEFIYRPLNAEVLLLFRLQKRSISDLCRTRVKLPEQLPRSPAE